ncbi:MAG: L-threonylcarbamoyladenylate synthase [Pseudomonadota bacterium]|nr:L-threonylcarbamoyladenylate synthase [Pseudomonadota bacterium]
MPREPLDFTVACGHLAQGHVIAYPTEAVWGLGCDPHNRDAVERVVAIKHRSMSKGLILVAASIDQLGTLLDSLSKTELSQLRDTWPGPVTWLIPDSNNEVPHWIKGENGSVAIRVSAHPVVRALCLQFGKPLVSTSANIAGSAEIRSLQELKREFSSKVDFIVEGGLGSDSATSEIRDLKTGRVIR